MLPPPPPQQQQQRMILRTNRHIPAELISGILSNLPVKSLLRFSSVSKSWNSTISDSGFVKRYRGRERVAFVQPAILGDKSLSCPLSSISSKNPTMGDATDFDCTLSDHDYDEYKIEAVCDEMWLVRASKRRSPSSSSLYLWNPSMRTYKRLPEEPPNHRKPPWFVQGFVYGLGYDSGEDDYKVLIYSYGNYADVAHLYSLRDDGSWRRVITRLAVHISHHVHDASGVAVGGKLHWWSGSGFGAPAIVSFDLSTERFGMIPLKKFSVSQGYGEEKEKKMSVLREMLCVSITRVRESHSYCEVWVMEEYGVAESWTEKFRFVYFHPMKARPVPAVLVPLYRHEDGEIVVSFGGKILLHKDEKSMPAVVAQRLVRQPFVYVDSLVAPALWYRRSRGDQRKGG